MVFESIAGTIEGLKIAGNVAKSLIDIRDATIIQTKVLELQSAILAAQGNALTAQSEQFSVLQRVRDLEAQIRDLEAWDREKQRYELVNVGQNKAYAYALKANAEPTEIAHYICANCYNKGEKSLLQPAVKDIGRAETLECVRCGAIICTRGVLHEQAPQPGRGRR